jgi:hypothetical protein
MNRFHYFPKLIREADMRVEQLGHNIGNRPAFVYQHQAGSIIIQPLHPFKINLSGQPKRVWKAGGPQFA